MNHYKALQIASGANAGRWHYTCFNDRDVSPRAAGACAYNCDGHASPEDAYGHEKAARIAAAALLGPKTDPWPKHCCDAPGCQNEALYHAVLGPYHVKRFCEACKERFREILDAIYSVGESFSS